ncbi:MAG: YggS family pyridoxal phosphate-dependent enzyme [Pseudomonadota bacterium]
MVQLVAASKRQPDDRINAALAAGHRCFGENRVQEAQQRWSHRREIYPDLKLHLIGPLQTNKSEDAVALFDVIETLDRPKLARTLAAAMEKTGRDLPCLIQVNTGEEPQKSGVVPLELDALFSIATEECGLTVSGLMCIPPADEPAAPHFALLGKLGAALGVPLLSMGMSADYVLAAQMGATHVRVGSGMFGARDG